MKSEQFQYSAQKFEYVKVTKTMCTQTYNLQQLCLNVKNNDQNISQKWIF